MTAQPSSTAEVTITPAPSMTVEPTGTVGGNQVTICHHTGSAQNPYVMITINENALPAHRAHGDIIPAPPGGCPAGPTREPHPTHAPKP